MSNQPTYKGTIEGFPAEVVEKMLERQFEQTGKRDVSVFEENRTSDKQKNGFDWDNTIERHNFWHNVIYVENFSVFFERYPKTEPNFESADLHQQIADLQARLDLAVKALDEIGKMETSSIRMAYEVSRFIAKNTLTQIKGGADDNG